ncbi:cytochrome bd oxidase small subunit CydS [Bacillus sp. NTK034]
MAEFVMFYAPFIVIIASIAAAFWLAGKDGRIEE